MYNMISEEPEVELELQQKDNITTFSRRNVAVIALQILQMIPAEKKELYEDLNRLIKNDFSYKDDQNLKDSYNWKKLQIIMHKHIPLVDEKWKEAIVDVFIGK